MRFTWLAGPAVAIAFLSGAQAASASQSVPVTLLKPPQPKVHGSPFSRLFKVADFKTTRAVPSQPDVVCGMTMIPGDPEIDRGISMKRPKTDTRFTIRPLPPTLCK